MVKRSLVLKYRKMTGQKHFFHCAKLDMNGYEYPFPVKCTCKSILEFGMLTDKEVIKVLRYENKQLKEQLKKFNNKE